MDYKVGQRFRLKEHVGYDPQLNDDDPRHPSNADKPTRTSDGWMVEPHVGMHPLFAGQVCEVVGHVPAGVAGGGQLHEEVVVLQFKHHRFQGHGPDPENPMHGETDSLRNVSFTPEQMDALFDPEDAA